MKTQNISIRKNEWLSDALKNNGYDMIPTNVILDKTLTGIGATYGELIAKRNSIIIEPNVPVILCKTENENEYLGVYAKTTEAQIKAYLNRSDIVYKKIITTPESFRKVRKVATTLKLNLYTDFFCLFDECEKITQDSDYRPAISQPIGDFFRFTNKAFVSATPLSPSHPEFTNQDFSKIKIQPDYNYKKDITLIFTNSFINQVRETLANLADSNCICIFFNKTDAINKLIEELGITDYKIFCSEKSVKKLNERFIENASETVELPLAKYNFFTCRFYSGLDIILHNQNPDIIILTNLATASYTAIDPFTDAIQIQGRFRLGFNTLTHITTVNPQIKTLSTKEVETKIDVFKENYETAKANHTSETDTFRKQALLEDMNNLKYNDFLDEDGEINYFAIDNYHNEERVKGYYQSMQNLITAYQTTQHFNINVVNAITTVGQDDYMIISNTKSEKGRMKLIAECLERIRIDYENELLDDKRREEYIKPLKGYAEYKYIAFVFDKIGIVGIEKAKYLKGQMNKAVKQHDKEQAEELRFSPDVLKAIETEFETEVYIAKDEIKQRLKNIYYKFDIDYKVTQDTIKDYFETKVHGANYKLVRFSPKR